LEFISFMDNSMVYRARIEGVSNETWDYLLGNVIDGIGIQ